MGDSIFGEKAYMISKIEGLKMSDAAFVILQFPCGTHENVTFLTLLFS